MWPFGSKNKNDDREAAAREADGAPETAAEPSETPAVAAPEAPDAAPDADETGPFDAQADDIGQFDFSSFAKATVNLGSIILPVPHVGDVQVEMGPQGPTMLHLVTAAGRMTPVAFAAPTSGGQWAESAREIAEGLSRDGLVVRMEKGPWGDEVVGEKDDLAMRILGADGPRWMLRMTLSGPKDKAHDLTEVGRGVMARTFVYRGDDPMPAGQVLPVTLPAQMADQVRKAYQRRQEQLKQQAAEQQGGATQ
ncbi:DUF3710 domain-containing protein [Corynebacterium sp.]|uniref:DUF3710 domain-containing protein n=1 Tax=Corynebacterium sp. TaxID=1720 RepID=UPI0026DC9A3A|nr:DUF3710 domain-containing protein [Corynebacterium sp.]MDO4609498.1 DUF3710 domain-containing protein [Corynebacterium sp.]